MCGTLFSQCKGKSKSQGQEKGHEARTATGKIEFDPLVWDNIRSLLFDDNLLYWGHLYNTSKLKHEQHPLIEHHNKMVSEEIQLVGRNRNLYMFVSELQIRSSTLFYFGLARQREFGNMIKYKVAVRKNSDGSLRYINYIEE